jgi:YegS/Rv2252/BmrU family lipid kinase
MYHIVVNPSAKSGTGKRLWNEITEPYLRQNKIEYKVWFSQQAGDLTRIAGDICATQIQRPLQVVVLGGDGTMNEFLQGIQPNEDIILGYVPTGSGNDFSRALHIPSDTLEALDQVFRFGTPTRIDLGEVVYPDGAFRRFIVSCGIGFDAAVCEAAGRSPLKVKLNKIKLGKLIYLLTALKEIFTAQRANGVLTLDGKKKITVKRLLFVAGMNEPYEGGGFLFGPNARDNDGKLDLCLVQQISRPKVLAVLPFGLKGKQFLFRGVTEHHAKEYEITLDAPLWVHTDGEASRRTDSLKVRSIVSSIRVIKPSDRREN